MADKPKVSQEWERDFTFALIGASEAFGAEVVGWGRQDDGGNAQGTVATRAAEWAEAMADAAAAVRKRRKVEPSTALKGGLAPQMKPGERPSSDIPL